MKKLLYSILAFAALLSVSCSRELPDPTLDVADGNLVRIHAYAEPATRTAYENEREFSWQEGDKISILIQNKAGTLWDIAEFTALSSGPETDFEGLIPNDYKMADYAFYPYGTGNDYYSSDLGLVIGEDGNPLLRTWGTITPDMENPMASIPLIGKQDGEGNFSFKTATGILKVTVSDIPEDAYMVKLDIANGTALNGNFSFGEDCTLKMENVDGTAWGQKYVTFDSQEMDGPVNFYFPIPVGTIPAGLKVSVATKAGDLLIATTTKPIEIVRNKVVETPGLEVPESGWLSIGTGKYMDDHGYYYLGYYGRTAADYLDVEIERNVLETNRYRIKNPYLINDEAEEILADADEYLYLKVKSDGVVDNEPYYWAADKVMFDPAWYHDDLYLNNRVLGYLADGMTPSNIQLAPYYFDCVKEDEEVWLLKANCAQNPKIEIVFPGAEPMLAGHFNDSEYAYVSLNSFFDVVKYNVVMSGEGITGIDIVQAGSLMEGLNALTSGAGSIGSTGFYYVNPPSSGSYDLVFRVNTTYNSYVYKHTGNKTYQAYSKISLTDDMIKPIATSEEEGSVAALVDGDISTYWRSPYGSEAEPWHDETYGIYIDIDLASKGITVKDFLFDFCLRNSYNDHPDHIKLYASADGENWGDAILDWTDIYEQFSQTRWSSYAQCHAPEGTAYLRISILQSYGYNGTAKDLTQEGCTHMAELELYASL